MIEIEIEPARGEVVIRLLLLLPLTLTRLQSSFAYDLRELTEQGARG